MMKCPSLTTIVLLLTVSLFNFTALFAKSATATTYQLSCTRSFSDNEEVTVIYEKLHNRAADYRSQLRSLQLALYKVEDVKTFFNKAIF